MNIKRIAFVSVSVNILILLLFAGKRMTHQKMPAANYAKLENPYFDKVNAGRTSVYNLLPIDSSDIVFVGNSITEGFPLHEMFPGLHVKNRGIGGNQARHILGRIKEIAAGRPKKLFFDIGVNDLHTEVPVDSIILEYGEILDTVRAISPNTQLYVHSVFPVGPAFDAIVDSIPALNARLRMMCRAYGVTYIDLYYRLLKGRYIDAALTYDDVHLKGPGYLIWKGVILPLL